MNCKPGDLAIVTKSFAGYEGVIVEVKEFQGEVRFFSGVHLDCWTCLYRGELSPCPDKYLRPVSGLSDGAKIVTLKDVTISLPVDGVEFPLSGVRCEQ